MKKDYKLNKVDGFNPFEHLEEKIDWETGETKLDPKTQKPMLFLPAEWKETWFYLVHPSGSIKCREIPLTAFDTAPKNSAVYKYEAEVYRGPKDNNPKTATAVAYRPFDEAGTMVTAQSVQKMAIGMALSQAGFGCEVEAELKTFLGDVSSSLGVSRADDVANDNKAPNSDSPDIVEITSNDVMEMIKNANKEGKAEEDKSQNASGTKNADTEAKEDRKEEAKGTSSFAITKGEDEKTEVEPEEKKEAKKTVFKVTKEAPGKLKVVAGKTMGELEDDYNGFSKMLVSNSSLYEHCVTPEVFRAAKIIAK